MDDRREFRPARGPTALPAGVIGAGLVAALVLAAVWTAPAGARPTGDASSPTPMAGGAPMDHGTPFYREGTFHALVGGVVIAGGVLVYRILRSRPRRRAGPAGFVSEGVLAVDLVDSTRLATHFGEAVALDARNALDERVRRLTERTRTFLETTGDGCLVTFPAATPALESAVALLRELDAQPTALGSGGRLEVRAGVTYGEILLDARGVRHGTAINKAFRFLGICAGDLAELKGESPRPSLPERTRILVDEDVAQEVGQTAPLRFVGFARLKGFTGLHGLYEADWQAGGALLPVPGSLHAVGPRDRLRRQGGMP